MLKPATEQKKRFSAEVAPASCSTNSGEPLHSEWVTFLIMLYLHVNIQSIIWWALTLAQEERAIV